MIMARALTVVAFAMFFVSLVFQSVPAAVGGVAVAFLAFVAAHYDPRGTRR
jgi:hypothetical protein